MSNLDRYLTKLFFITICLQGLIALCWICLNFTELPSYGDTGEYLALADTLKPDSWRGVLYPLLIALCKHISSEHFLAWLYLIQLSLYALAVFLWVNQARAELSFFGFSALLISLFSNPLAVHFNLSLLSDSLSLSLFMLCFIFCLRALQSKVRQSSSLFYFMLTFCLMALTRPEKFYFGIIAVLCCVFLLSDPELKNRQTSRYRAKAVCLTLFFASCLVFLIKYVSSDMQPSRAMMETRMWAAFLEQVQSFDWIMHKLGMTIAYVFSPFVFLYEWSPYMFSSVSADKLSELAGGGRGWAYA